MKQYVTPTMGWMNVLSEDILTTSTFEQGDSTNLPKIGFGEFEF